VNTRLLVACVALASAGAIPLAQGRSGAPWSTTANDAQRTSWVRSDPKITKDALQKGGVEFLWSAKLDNQPGQSTSLTQPVLLPNIISYKGFKALAFIGGNSDNVYAIDYDLNRPFWKRHLETASTTPGAATCPGGPTTITRQTPLSPPNPSANRGSFLGAGGSVNAPGVGRRGAPVNPNAPGRGAPAAAGRGAGPAGRSGGRGGNNNVYAVSSGGAVHALNPQTGEDAARPKKLVAANANVIGSILIDNTLFVAATGHCGAAANGVYAVDVTDGSNDVRSWDANGAAIAGTAGMAFSPSGVMYVATAEGAATGNSIVALDAATLKQKGVFKAPAPFVSSPTVVEVSGRELVAAAAADGKVYLLDGASLGAGNVTTALATLHVATGDAFAPGSLAAWVSDAGTGWILVPVNGRAAQAISSAAPNGPVTNGSIVALKIVEQNGSPALQPAWTSRDLSSPLTPAIVNDVVFAVSSGESRRGTPAAGVKTSSAAVLYALDARTGKELWNSGTRITSFAHAIGPSAGDSQVYVVAHDGTVYAFGIPLEH
jgi:outer membrane protein assembly factor BamB